MGMNGDPLLGGPEQERLLFEEFRRLSAGRSLDAVFGAAINLIVNAIRQSEAKRSDAEARYDVLMGKGKSLLLESHYDSVTGRRKTVFPYTQVIKMPFHDADNDEVMG